MFTHFNNKKKLENKTEFYSLLARKNTLQTLSLLNTSKHGLTQKASQQRRDFYRKRYADSNINLDHFLTLLRQFFLLKKETMHEKEKWMVTVRRQSGNGIPITFEIPHHELVPGDIIQVKKGDIIPSNIRILASNHLVVNQACYIGVKDYQKKYPCEKILDWSTEDKLVYISMLQLPQFCLVGTEVVSGTALAVVLTASNKNYFSQLKQEVNKKYKLLNQGD
ncbi:hypothetical protein GKC56_06025 [Neisseriaceae bacterium PsAf]|nr:hypothetical protein [Neisseriaceae bacterium PsAf]